MAWVAREALQDMMQEAHRRVPDETGGILVGYWVEAPPQAVITAVIGPGPRAIHAPHRFVPDYDYHEGKLRCYYDSSGRTATYLGDWHTHPGGTARLSHLDRRTLTRIAHHPAARAPVPIMAILAGGDPWRLALWLCTLTTGMLPGTRTRVAALPIHLYA